MDFIKGTSKNSKLVIENNGWSSWINVRNTPSLNMRNKNVRGFFDEQFRLEKLTSQNDPLVKLVEGIDWEQFRKILNATFENEGRGIGGRPPFGRRNK